MLGASATCRCLSGSKDVARVAGREASSTKQRSGRGAKLAKLLTRDDRVSQRKELRKRLISASNDSRAGGGGSGGGGGGRAPHLITVLSLDDELTASELISCLVDADETATVTTSAAGGEGARPGITYLNVPRFRTRYGFLCVEPRRVEALLDCLRVSDALLLLWPTDADEVDAHRSLLDLLLAHGMPSLMHVVAGLPVAGKQREQLRKSLQRTIDKW